MIDIHFQFGTGCAKLIGVLRVSIGGIRILSFLGIALILLTLVPIKNGISSFRWCFIMCSVLCGGSCLANSFCFGAWYGIIGKRIISLHADHIRNGWHEETNCPFMHTYDEHQHNWKRNVNSRERKWVVNSIYTHGIHTWYCHVHMWTSEFSLPFRIYIRTIRNHSSYYHANTSMLKF